MGKARVLGGLEAGTLSQPRLKMWWEEAGDLGSSTILSRTHNVTVARPLPLAGIQQ